MIKAVILADDDTVATAMQSIPADTELRISRGERTVVVTTKEVIPLGHKLALRDHRAGDLVYKYGSVIGRASKDIPEGAWVHVHNLEGLRARGRRQE